MTNAYTSQFDSLNALSTHQTMTGVLDMLVGAGVVSEASKTKVLA